MFAISELVVFYKLLSVVVFPYVDKVRKHTFRGESNVFGIKDLSPFNLYYRDLKR